MKILAEVDFVASLIETRPLVASRNDARDLGQGWSTPDFHLHRLSTELQVSPAPPRGPDPITKEDSTTQQDKNCDGGLECCC
jgi:hypothetical protein